MFMRIKALIIRIIKQILHDKRTLALILFAPLLILSLVYFILNSENKSFTIGVINADDVFINELESIDDYEISTKILNESSVKDEICNGTVDGVVQFNDNKTIKIYLDGTDANVASKIQMLVKNTTSKMKADELKNNLKELNHKLVSMHQDPITFDEYSYEIQYLTGQQDSTLFDKFGSQLIGFIVYFFVFLIAGINFLTERTSGTLEKLLSTQIRRWEIIIGFVIGFSVLAILQSALISLFSIGILKLNIEGNMAYVLLIILVTAINALTLGILLSTIANSEFQMVQFIPIVIIPQLFLCGLFRVTGFWGNLQYIMPLHYTSDALVEVILRGNGFETIMIDIFILLGFSCLFICLNILLLKKQRRI